VARPVPLAFAIALLLVALATASRAETLPPRGAVDSRVRVVIYNPEDVVRLQGWVGYQITMQFAEGEEFVRLGVGDSEMIDVGRERNFVFLKPKVAQASTNMTLLTTRRHYHFDYSARNKTPDPKRDEVIYALRFVYPQDEAAWNAAELERARIEGRLARSAAARPRNADYWYCGAEALKPVAASDDGVHTRIRFGARSEMPAIFLKNDDRSESLVNVHLQGEEVVIHRVAREFVLRRGALAGCIVNKGWDGGGRRLDSGTVSPEVRRSLQGG
jgi:type IV secretion system protein VirB9